MTTGENGARTSSLPKLERNLALVEVLREIGRQHGVEPGVVAIAWTLRNPAITAAIVGARRPDQVDGVMPAATFRLSDAEAQQIEQWLAAASVTGYR